MKRFIPNLITLLNLVSGCFAIDSAINGDMNSTILFLSASLIFDFFDGLVARLLHAYSDLGKELDSLADLVSFGVAPAFLLRWYLSQILGEGVNEVVYLLIVNAPFVMVASTAFRLARFNLDKDQSNVFKGLPAPANALLVVAFLNILSKSERVAGWPSGYVVGIVLMVIAFQSYILASTFPMFALKFTNYTFSDNKIRFAFIAISALAFIILGFSGFYPVIMLYICVSIIQSYTKDY